MKSSTDISKVEQRVFPAQVVQIIDDTRLAINRGSIHKVRLHQRVLLYCLSSEEIKDPETGESLGYLEIYKGTGKVITVQDKISVIESDRYEFTEALVKSVTHPLFSSNFWSAFPNHLTRVNKIPFEELYVDYLIDKLF